MKRSMLTPHPLLSGTDPRRAVGAEEINADETVKENAAKGGEPTTLNVAEGKVASDWEKIKKADTIY